MGLTIHGPRRLSQLERDAVSLVFGDSESFSDENLHDVVRIQVVNSLVSGNDEAEGDQANGLIRISKRQHPYTDDIDHSNTRGNTDLWKPGNLYYLDTFIHEAAHWWQKDQNRYTDRTPDYDFDYDMVRDLDFPCKEGHAAAVAVAFILSWQLRYRPTNQNVDLTHSPRFKPEFVGKVNRYEEIRNIATQSGSNNPPAGRHVTRTKAQQLLDAFNILLDQLNGN